MELRKVAIIEDEKVIRENLYTFLSTSPDLDVCSVNGSVEGFLQEVATNRGQVPEIILLDIQLPGMSGIEGISWIKEKLPEVDIIMLTTFEDPDSIFAALSEGACSYLSKRTRLSDIRDAILVVSRGGSYMSPSIARKVVQHFNPKKKKSADLTPRQRQIVQGIVKGYSYQQIADHLFISIDTVRSHIKKVYSLLNINSKAELIRKSLNREL